MIGLRAVACVMSVFAVLAATPTSAQTPASTQPSSPVVDPAEAVATSQRAIGRTIGNYRFVDTTGKPLSLDDYRGKPLVISLIYSSCSTICPPTTQRVIDAATEAGRVFGLDRFNVLTVGFDARNDTVARMAQFASNQGIKLPNWRVASGDPAAIEGLLSDLGFAYRAVAGGFDHVTQTTIVDRNGKVYRHVYGEDFPSQMFMEPMKDVIYGTTTPFTLDGILDRIRFICTAYDPNARHYRLDYSVVVGGVLAAFSLLAMGGWILREWRRSAQA